MSKLMVEVEIGPLGVPHTHGGGNLLALSEQEYDRASRLAAAYVRLKAEVIANVDVHANLDLFAIIQTIDAIEKEK